MNTKNAGIIPFLIVLLTYSSLSGEQPGEAAIVVPIIKLHALPSAESDTKGFAYSGQHIIIDGESGSWYRVRFNDATSAWVTKDAVNVLSAYNPEPDQPLAAFVQDPGCCPSIRGGNPGPGGRGCHNPCRTCCCSCAPASDQYHGWSECCRSWVSE